MARKPDIGIWVEFRDVTVELGGGLVVPILSSQGFDKARLVTGEDGRGAVADFLPQVMPALAAATAEEEVVVDLVLCGGAGAVEHGRGGAFEGNDNGFVAFVGEDVATEAVFFPTKRVRIVEAGGHVLPFATAVGILIVCVCGHYGEVDDGFFVGDIGSGDFIEGPS